MDIINIPVTEVDPRAAERVRPIIDDQARQIGTSMQTYGQHAPIQVRPKNAEGLYPLIAGGHRWRGAVLVGMTHILAVVHDVSDDEARLLELDENLSRHELNELDRAVFLAERKALWDRMYPASRRGAARWRNQTDTHVSLIRSFSSDVAEKLGLSTRTIDRSIARATQIMPDVRAMLAGSLIAQSGRQLDAIALLEAAEQRTVVEWMLGAEREGKPISVRDAIRIVRNVPTVRADEFERQYDRLVSAWEKANEAIRTRFRAFIATPAPKKGRGK